MLPGGLLVAACRNGPADEPLRTGVDRDEEELLVYGALIDGRTVPGEPLWLDSELADPDEFPLPSSVDVASTHGEPFAPFEETELYRSFLRAAQRGGATPGPIETHAALQLGTSWCTVQTTHVGFEEDFTLAAVAGNEFCSFAFEIHLTIVMEWSEEDDWQEISEVIRTSIIM